MRSTLQIKISRTFLYGYFIPQCYKNIGYFCQMESSNNIDSRLYAISDLHVDYKQNKEFVESWSNTSYQKDGLIVAGDVTDKLPVLQSTLECLKTKFREVFYVPGNHELWIRSANNYEEEDSISKFHSILEMCERIGVKTKPHKFWITPAEHIWVVPLFSWYTKPEEDQEDTLHFAPAQWEENVSWMEQVWMDNHLCKWDTLPSGLTKSKYFSSLNQPFLNQGYSPVISFSHFVPNLELVRSVDEDKEQVEIERKALGIGHIEQPVMQGGAQGFNFTRYAGSKILQSQIIQLNPSVHIYGHQHRNRDREVNGIRYVSHCLGNPREQKDGWVWGLSHWKGPKQIWPKVDLPV